MKIMAIVNLTNDSFFSGSHTLREDGSFDEACFLGKVGNARSEGADIIDLGPCSSRPGSTPVGPEEEWRRLEPALRLLRQEYPGTPLSIDTYWPDVIRKAYDLAGPFMVNDITGGSPELLTLVARLNLPYIAMDSSADPVGFFERFAEKAEKFRVADWILDPGFGFGKTVEDNWRVLRDLQAFRRFGRPVLAGLSRKTMLWKPLGISPEEALPATQIVNFIALDGGAEILRVHDVAETVRTVKLHRLLRAGAGTAAV
ncbi:MAG: dihydropteroate synthase [Bacteroidales bacterium]|jgi:dihydropteroate synthase|nr:dihydropteroate synthase [Bacteroidota bacterium]NLN99641.1 dihydropteroate synthase [Bacteroidales bacterium]